MEFTKVVSVIIMNLLGDSVGVADKDLAVATEYSVGLITPWSLTDIIKQQV